MKPITPSEAITKAVPVFPDEVLESFNQLIVKNLSSGSATVGQNEVLHLITKKLKISGQVVFDKGFLNIESVYQKAGWIVKYDKPGFNESYEPNFVFTAKNKGQR